MMGIGYCLMCVHNDTHALYIDDLVIVGNGFFKPNISTLLGNVYSTPQYIKHKKMKAIIFFTWASISVPSFAISLELYSDICYGWADAFVAAGVGMFIGVMIFIAGTRHYKEYDIRKALSQDDMSLIKILASW